jgi:signal transduction histidine kinase
VTDSLSVPDQTPATTPPHVLIAEDDLPSSAVLRTVLGRAGYRVTVVADGPSALRFLDENGPPDVLLLDWMLPGMSGLDVCHRARQRWDTIALPILMVTAKTDAESISAAFDAGASDYITKPYLGAELRARVAAHLRTKHLVEERQQMEEHLREREKLSSLGLLVSSVAHDLNNPLSSISGYAQLLLFGEPDAQKAADLRLIMSEVERCRRIVGNLLGFARRHPAERAETELAPILRSTFDLRERFLRTSGVDAALIISDALPQLTAVGHQLQQVFLNILLNAEQALRQSGGVLRVTAECAAPVPSPSRGAPPAGAPGGCPTAASAAVMDGERLWIAVDFFNDGPPIPAAIVPHIFDPFFTTKSKEEGTGLGLSICRRIVREHGGEITVQSSEEGTTFRVLLPAASGEAPTEG